MELGMYISIYRAKGVLALVVIVYYFISQIAPEAI